MESNNYDNTHNIGMDEINWQESLSIHEIIQKRAKSTPNKVPLILLSESGEEQTISYARLDADARYIALTLQNNSIQPEDVVMIIFPQSYEQIASFIGVIYYGAIPTIFTDNNQQPEAFQGRAMNLVNFSGAKAILTFPEVARVLTTQINQEECALIPVPELNGQLPETSPILSNRGGDDIVHIQFSTGSMGMSKGIMLSHSAVINQVCAFYQSRKLSTKDTLIGWLPCYNALGLNIQIILPLMSSISSYLIQPGNWLKRPVSLFQAIHRYKGTITWMPNFAFNYCTKILKTEEIKDLDLSSWQSIGNGGEPVSIKVMQSFAENFAPNGLAPTALAVAYGMNEIGFIAITCPEKGIIYDWVSRHALQIDSLATPIDPNIASALPIASCGFPVPGIELRIVDLEGNSLPDRSAGEVLVRSRSVFTRYHQQPDLTASVLQNGWLHTGDLGYMVDGQLYIYGRKKELIIAGGQKVLPHHIEEVALASLGSVTERVVAFGIEDSQSGTELPILVCEINENVDPAQNEGLARRIRHRILEEIGIALGNVCFVSRGWVVVTPIGKVVRSANRQKYLDNFQKTQFTAADSLSSTHPSPLQDISPQTLTKQVGYMFKEILGVAQVNPDDNFYSLGGDSLSALRLVLKVAEQTGKEVPAEFFRKPTVTHLVKLLTNNKPLEQSKPRAIYKEKPNRSQQHSITPFSQLNFVRKILHTEIGFQLRIKVLVWLCKQSWFYNRFYPEQVRITKDFYATLENPLSSEAETIQASLANNIAREWEHPFIKLPKSQAISRWTKIQGEEYLQSATWEGHGVILLSLHGIANHIMFHIIEQKLGKDYLIVHSEFGKRHKHTPQDERRRSIQSYSSEQITQAYHFLKSGGTVLLAGDGSMGANPVSYPFHNRLWKFNGGAYQLAQSTGATIVPLFSFTDLAWHVMVEFYPPLQDISHYGKNHDGENISSVSNKYTPTLMDKYVDCLSRFWSTHPEAISWRVMRKHLAKPTIIKSHPDNPA